MASSSAQPVAEASQGVPGAAATSTAGAPQLQAEQLEPWYLRNAKQLAPAHVREAYAGASKQLQTLLQPDSAISEEDEVTVLASWLETTAKHKEWDHQKMAGHILSMEAWQRYVEANASKRGRGKTDLTKVLKQLERKGLSEYPECGLQYDACTPVCVTCCDTSVYTSTSCVKSALH